MDMDEEDRGDDEVSLEDLEKRIKTNRRLFISVLVAMVVAVSILGTSLVVINVQLASRAQVPAEAFDQRLVALDKHLKHIQAIHNSEAQVYEDFQASLGRIRRLLTRDELNALRRTMVEQEQAHRRLLDLMSQGLTNLASMVPGNHPWDANYAQLVAEAKQVSREREQALRLAMTAEPPVGSEAEAAAETSEEDTGGD